MDRRQHVIHNDTFIRETALLGFLMPLQAVSTKTCLAPIFFIF